MDIVIVARMGSSRLPGKTLEKITDNITMIEFLINRLKKSEKIGRIILATSDLKNDDVLYRWALSNDILVFRGSSENVLKRISDCISFFSINHFAFILGDNPLVDHRILDYCIDTYRADNKLDFLTTHSMEYSKYHDSEDYFPVGIRVQIMNFNTINKVINKVNSASNKEHSSSYIIENLFDFKYCFVTASNPFQDYKLKNFNFAVNTQNQLDSIRKIHFMLRDTPDYSIADVISLIKSNKSNFNLLKL